MNQPTVAVIIAAFNAAGTIGRSVKSALAQDEVSEVVVVDDCSSDDTGAIATASASGDPRLKVLRQPCNLGPSAARNRAIDESTSDILAILDADDVFMAERLRPMVSSQDWDLCADNILFVDHISQIPDRTLNDELAGSTAAYIDAVTFIRGNISVRGRVRGELGFLKPLIRRSALQAHDLRYEEGCRLGEDFLLYCDLLLRGATFKLIRQCGYAALVRPDSLSARHDADALEALHWKTEQIRAGSPPSAAVRRALGEHMRHVRRKILHRRALATKQKHGLVAGMAYAVSHPTAAFDILREAVQGPPSRVPTPTRLLSDEDYHMLCTSEPIR